MIDGTGLEQDGGSSTSQGDDDGTHIDGVPKTLQHKKQVIGENDASEHGHGRLATSDGSHAIGNQSVVDSDAYAGSSESGV